MGNTFGCFSSNRIKVEEINGSNITVYDEKKKDKFVIYPECECIICQECSPNILFQPCGHSCTCYKCFQLGVYFNHFKRCPMCRSYIDDVEPLKKFIKKKKELSKRIRRENIS